MIIYKSNKSLRRLYALKTQLGGLSSFNPFDLSLSSYFIYLAHMTRLRLNLPQIDSFISKYVEVATSVYENMLIE